MSEQKTAPLIIVPAAGFGRRVGSPQSKEMLPRPDGLPLIETVREQALRLNWPVHVVTREEKTGLRGYLEGWTSVQLISPQPEWPATVLASESQWREWNLLFLPDIEFAPAHILDRMWEATRSNDLVAAVFETDDLGSWGAIRITSPEKFEMAEKPPSTSTENRAGAVSFAWGFLLFRREIGRALFEGLLESSQDHQWKSFSSRGDFVRLDRFIDLTR